MKNFKLRKVIAPSAHADPNDLIETKSTLSSLGFYPKPADGVYGDWADRDLFSGIKRFQQTAGLKVDGVMKPGGPTENALSQYASHRVPRSVNLNSLEQPTMCACTASDDNPYREY